MPKYARALSQGMQVAPTGARHSGDEVSRLLRQSRDPDVSIRALATRNLCTCHLQRDDAAVWARLLELFHDDDVGVRRDALHAITDSTPASRVADVVDALEVRRNDPDPRLRKRIRRTLAHYRRSGTITDAPR